MKLKIPFLTQYYGVEYKHSPISRPVIAVDTDEFEIPELKEATISVSDTPTETLYFDGKSLWREYARHTAKTIIRKPAAHLNPTDFSRLAASCFSVDFLEYARTPNLVSLEKSCSAGMLPIRMFPRYRKSYLRDWDMRDFYKDKASTYIERNFRIKNDTLLTRIRKPVFGLTFIPYQKGEISIVTEFMSRTPAERLHRADIIFGIEERDSLGKYIKKISNLAQMLNIKTPVTSLNDDYYYKYEQIECATSDFNDIWTDNILSSASNYGRHVFCAQDITEKMHDVIYNADFEERRSAEFQDSLYLMMLNFSKSLDPNAIDTRKPRFLMQALEARRETLPIIISDTSFRI